jgi:hypothetical protein
LEVAAMARQVLWLFVLSALVVSPVIGLPVVALHELGHAVGGWLSGGSVDGMSVGLDLAGRTEVRGGHLVVVVIAGPLLASALPAVAAWSLGRASSVTARRVGFVAVMMLLRATLDVGWHGVLALSGHSDAAALAGVWAVPPWCVGGLGFAMSVGLTVAVGARYWPLMVQVFDSGPKPTA